MKFFEEIGYECSYNTINFNKSQMCYAKSKFMQVASD